MALASFRLLKSLVTPSRLVAHRPAAIAPMKWFSTEQTKDELGPLDELVRDFLAPEQFYNLLDERGVRFYTGVPDSLLKDFCAYVADTVPATKHVMAANEGAAISLAAGYHMATGKVPLVYLQNSGLGNIINPLLSLAHPDVYSIPMLILVGWRGEPGKKDEPQHRVQGKMTPGLLASMNIPFEVLPDYEDGAAEVLDSAVKVMLRRQSPFVLLVKRQTFEKYSMKQTIESDFPLTREDFLRIAVRELGKWDVVVSTTGFASRELFELREELGQGHGTDFLTVGSMGHASAIAAGIAIAKPSRQVFCMDGDGAMIMHMGTMTTIASQELKNLKHVIINNGAHDSVGGQLTAGLNVDVAGMGKAMGYKYSAVASTEEEITAALKELRNTEGPGLLEVRVRPGARKNLGRPTTTTHANKQEFMTFLDH